MTVQPLREKPPDYIEPTTPQSKLIDARLKELNSTWSALARSIGITHNYFIKVRKGTNNIRKPETIQKIAEALRMDADDLYLAGGYLPPDVVQTILKYPSLIAAVRKAGAQFDAQQEPQP